MPVLPSAPPPPQQALQSREAVCNASAGSLTLQLPECLEELTGGGGRCPAGPLQGQQPLTRRAQPLIVAAATPAVFPLLSAGWLPYYD